MNAPLTHHFNPLRLEILANALTAATEEIQMTVLRSAYSQVVKEAQDASCAIFSGKGQLVAQPVAIPGHLGSMKFMLEETLKDFPLAELRPGDVLMTNDPYRGGSHLPDIALFRPIFHEGRCIAFAGSIIHHTDVGGMVPGSNPVKATELYQEGLIIPPSKLVEAGVDNATLVRMIRANVRVPDIVFGDLQAQKAALFKGEERILALAGRFGADGLVEAMEMLIEHSERKTREAIARIKEGVFEFEDHMDHDGVDLSKPVKIKVKLTVANGRLSFDFTGTDPQVKGPLNSPLSKVWTTVFYCVRCVLPEDVPFNEGLTRLIDIYVPLGTALNPHFPAPVNARSVTVARIADTALGALALAVPERIGAQSCGVPTGISFGGVDPRTGLNFVFYESYNGGMGGTQQYDGADAVSTGTSNQMNIPVESVEIDYPIRVLRYELVRDAAGSGEHRGGLGLRREYEMLAESATVNIRGDRANFAPAGSHGGHDGSKSLFQLEDENGVFQRVPSKYTGHLKRGQHLLITTPGGAGFGLTAKRSRQQLIDDYLDGRVSLDKIKADFGDEALPAEVLAKAG